MFAQRRASTGVVMTVAKSAANDGMIMEAPAKEAEVDWLGLGESEDEEVVMEEEEDPEDQEANLLQ